MTDSDHPPEYLPDFRTSCWLQFGGGAPVPGDPASPELFDQTLRLLEAITDQMLASGSWLECTPADLAGALAEHNAHSAEAAAQQGEPYTATTLAQLQALSIRRILAFEETGWNLTAFYRPICAIDQRIAQAATATEHEPSCVSALPTLQAATKALAAGIAVTE
jgi:hypothetical protein